MKEQVHLLKVVRYILIVLAAITIGTGSYHMFIYENSDSYYGSNINAYVGGDAYNFIINATRATAYFVVGFGSLITVFLNEILMHILTSEDKNRIKDHTGKVLQEPNQQF